MRIWKTVTERNRIMEKKTVYISGAIAHHDIDERKEAFRRAGERLGEMGYEYVNPFDNGLPDDATWQEHMREDILMMLSDCDCIYMLRGWEKSKGAKLELDVASSCGMEVMFETDGLETAGQTDAEDKEYGITEQKWEKFTRYIIKSSFGMVALDVTDVNLLNNGWCQAYIWNLYVDEDKRGRGCGNRLIERAEQLAMELGHETVCLEFENGNRGWIKQWYARHGYAFDRWTEQGQILWKRVGFKQSER